ncbi:LAME_0E13256g1_1 [Lachancea meyersii CBS 8951]|uniref:LAME_0E13256g1_1 n=1 Tax=Lachancea meyersii CBS 8951 TaxID=1266667 RepID=A0A1G4JM69_9SACH|nr:LAME_0E13256g1_1 [Lachancea meyersii CBS 8951]
MLSSKELRIIALLVIDTLFFFLEIVVGYAVNSLALIADSFHMLNDIFSLLVAFWAVGVAKNKSADSTYTYGWKRAEILGALINAVFLIALCVSILIEAIQRFFQPQVIENPKLVLTVGFAGLMSNIVGLFLFHEHGHSHGHGHGHGHSHGLSQDDDFEAGSGSLQGDLSRDDSSRDINDMLPSTVVHTYTAETTCLLGNKNDHAHSHDHDHDNLDNNNNNNNNNNRKQPVKAQKSLNMQGVFLHVLGDALGNVGVMATALFIWKTDYSWRFYTDPAVSLVITVIIFSSAMPLANKASRILLQATPPSISADDVQNEILQVPGVVSVHDFHIWNLTEAVSVGSVHIEIDANPVRFTEVAKTVRSIFHRHNVHSATVQPEFRNVHASESTFGNSTSLGAQGQIADGATYGSIRG